jgi:hypothetical protein
MLQHRRQAAEQVANALFETEAAIDCAIAAASRLTGIMPLARTEAKLAAVVGQDAFETAAAGLTQLILARREIVQTHHCLAETQVQVGLGAVSFGGGIDKPAALHETDRPLVLVSKTAAG